jgi:sugar phosphate isomerase/epimerase
MEFAISTLCIYGYPNCSVLQLIRENPGVRNWEIVDEGYHRLEKKLIRELKVLSRENIKFAVHAPFSSMNLSENDSSLRSKFVEVVGDSISKAAEIGAGIVVIHLGIVTPFSYWFPERAWEACALSLQMLVRRAKSSGVKIAAENGVGQYDLFASPDKIAKLLNGVDGGVYTCLDVGHAVLNGDINNFVRQQPRICHVHVHDNRGGHDEHLPAGRGIINWHSVLRELREVSYHGWLVAENNSIEDSLQTVKFLQSLFSQTPVENVC